MTQKQKTKFKKVKKTAKKKAAIKKKSAANKKKAGKKAGNNETEHWFSSIDGICKHYGIKKRTYLRRKGTPGYPKKLAKGYNLRTVDEFLKTSGLLKEENGLNKDQEQARAARARWRNQEFDLKIKQREFVPREVHQQKMTILAEIFLRTLFNFRDQVAARTRNAKMAEMAEKLVNAARREAAEEIENID